MSWTLNQEGLGLNPHIRDMLCYHMYFSKTCVYTQEVVAQSQMAEKLLTRIDKPQNKDPCVSTSKKSTGMQVGISMDVSPAVFVQISPTYLHLLICLHLMLSFKSVVGMPTDLLSWW